ncbi:MAG: hypothetical protein V1902_00600 [Candidatus Falkowbacteria bacterium]
MIKKNSKFSVIKTVGIVALIIIGIVVLLCLLGILRLETVTSDASGNNLMVCKSKRIVIGIGKFELPIGNGMFATCVY